MELETRAHARAHARTHACTHARTHARTHAHTSQEREIGGFKPEAEEEFEDGDGNVYNRKTYEDLKRQGLI